MTLDELRALAIHRDAEAGVTRFDHPYFMMSVCLEEAEFLHALVRALRPRRVLEIGTGYGLSAAFIAEALDKNDNGAMVFTYEPLPELRLAAQKNLEGFAAAVTGQPLSAGDALVDLVYIDSGAAYRNDDIREWLTSGYQGLVLVHDAEREYPELRLGAGVFLPTAEGMWLGRGR